MFFKKISDKRYWKKMRDRESALTGDCRRTAEYMLDKLRSLIVGISADLIEICPSSFLILLYDHKDKEERWCGGAMVTTQGYALSIPIKVVPENDRIEIMVSCRIFDQSEVTRAAKMAGLILKRIA